MKNKFNETGSDFGKIYYIVPKSNDVFSEGEFLANEPDYYWEKIRWTNPVASRKVLKELLELVNSEAEYNMLIEELAGLNKIIALQLLQIKGVCA